MINSAEKIISNGHHSNCRFRCLSFRRGFSRGSGGSAWSATATARGGLGPGALGFPTACRATILPAGFSGVLTFAVFRARICLSIKVLARVKARRRGRREISASEIFVFGGVANIKSRRLVCEKIVTVTVFITTAEIDDIVVVGVGNNAIGLGILRQFLVTPFCIVYQS